MHHSRRQHSEKIIGGRGGGDLGFLTNQIWTLPSIFCTNLDHLSAFDANLDTPPPWIWQKFWPPSLLHMQYIINYSQFCHKSACPLHDFVANRFDRKSACPLHDFVTNQHAPQWFCCKSACPSMILLQIGIPPSMILSQIGMPPPWFCHKSACPLHDTCKSGSPCLQVRDFHQYICSFPSANSHPPTRQSVK